MSRRRRSGHFLAAGVGVLIAGAVTAGLLGCGTSSTAEQPLSLRLSGSGLYPRFAVDRGDYVARCESDSPRIKVYAGQGTRVSVDGRRARSGRFDAAVGARPGQDFAISAANDDLRRAYEIRCLPSGFPGWSYQRLRPGPTGFFTVAFRPRGQGGAWIVIFDQAGMPRWWHRTRGRVLWAHVLRGGEISWSRAFGDGYGVDPRMAHEVHGLSGRALRVVRTEGSVTDGHEYVELPNGDVLLDTYVVRRNIDLSHFGGPRRTAVAFPQIQQLDRSGKAVWRWDSQNHLSLAESARWMKFVLSNPRPDPAGGRVYDAVHLNSIEPWGRHRLVIAVRHTDAVYGIDRASGRIVFKLGGVETPASLRVLGDRYPATEVFGGPHDARVDPGGRLSVYDDGTHRGRPPRLVRFDLDLRRGTATFVDQTTDPEVKGSHCCGSARRFGTGWLVDWGHTRVITAFDRRMRIAFRLRLPNQSYRAVPVPPAAATADDLDRGLEAAEQRP